MEKIMKLEWQENSLSNPMTWHEAMDYVNSLGNGWRLPTKGELDEAYRAKVKGFQSDGFCQILSTYAQGTNDAWYMSFYDGCAHHNNKNYRNHVRCVREVN